MKKIIAPFLVLIFILLNAAPINANAQIKIEPVIQQDQDRETLSPFSFTTEEGRFKREFEVEITNQADVEITLSLEPVNTLTSPQGGTHYTTNIMEENTSLLEEKYAMSDYISAKGEIKLAAGESKRIPVQLNVPELEGTVLGGLQFKKTETEHEQIEQNQEEMSFFIKNDINRIVAIQVNRETNQKPEIDIKSAYIETMPSYFTLRLPLYQHTPYLLEGVEIEYKVQDESKKTIFEGKYDQFNFAPKTMTNLAIPWDYESIHEGEYTLIGTISYAHQNHEIEKHFEKTFEFKQDNHIQSVATNGEIHTPPTIGESSNVLWWALLFLLLVIGFMIIIVIRKSRKKDDGRKRVILEGSATIESPKK